MTNIDPVTFVGMIAAALIVVVTIGSVMAIVHADARIEQRKHEQNRCHCRACKLERDR